MTPLVPAALKTEQLTPEHFMERYGVGREQALNMIATVESDIFMVNDIYRVSVSREVFPAQRVGWGDMIHVAVMRHDEQPIHNWSDLQEIKNFIVGPENEAIEIYPAESRLVDCANQYHLWCFTSGNFRVPIGWTVRMVSKEIEAAKQPQAGEWREP